MNSWVWEEVVKTCNIILLTLLMQPQRQQHDQFASNENATATNHTIEEQKAKIRDAYQQLQMVDCGFTDTETPSDEQKRLKRQELGLSPDVTHIAVAGASGKGRSTFVQLVSQYTDSERVKWHDIPGAGSQGTGYIDYFHKQGLYAYDVIIILMGDRVTDIDVGLALMFHRCGLPHIFIRTGSDKLIDGDESQMAEATTIVKEARQEIFSHLQKTLRHAHIPNIGDHTPFFLINRRALKCKLTGKGRRDIIYCDEEALLNYLRDTYNIIVPPKCPCTPEPANVQYTISSPPPANEHYTMSSRSPPTVHDTTPSPLLTYHNAEDSPSVFTVAVLTTSDAETSSRLLDCFESLGESHSEWRCLQNVDWRPLPEPKQGAEYDEYFESLKLSNYDVVIILASKYIRDFDVSAASYCEARHIHLIFVRVDCSLVRGSQDANVAAEQLRKEWLNRFSPERNSFPGVRLLRNPPIYFHIGDPACVKALLNVEGIARALHMQQEIEFLEYIRDLVKRRSHPHSESSNHVLEALDQLDVLKIPYNPEFPSQQQTLLEEKSHKQAPADGLYLWAGREIPYGKKVKPKP